MEIPICPECGHTADEHYFHYDSSEDRCRAKDCDCDSSEFYIYRQAFASLLVVAEQMAERLQSNKEVIDTHEFDENGYITAHKGLIFNNTDAVALELWENWKKANNG